MTEKTITMPEQVYDALKVILDEFVAADLGPRLRHLSDGGASELERGRRLLRAFDLAEAWHYDPNLTPDDIRVCLAQADDMWGEWVVSA